MWHSKDRDDEVGEPGQNIRGVKVAKDGTGSCFLEGEVKRIMHMKS